MTGEAYEERLLAVASLCRQADEKLAQFALRDYEHGTDMRYVRAALLSDLEWLAHEIIASAKLITRLEGNRAQVG